MTGPELNNLPFSKILSQMQVVNKDCNKGFSLFSTLLSLLVLAAISTQVQERFVSSSLLLSKVRKKHDIDLVKSAARARIVPLTFASVFAEEGSQDLRLLVIDGSEYLMVVTEKAVKVSVQDTSGLININLAHPRLLFGFFHALDPETAEQRVATVVRMRKEKTIENISILLIQLGLSFHQIDDVKQLIIPRSQSGKINPNTIPASLWILLTANFLSKDQTVQKIGRRYFDIKSPKKVIIDTNL